MNRFTILFMVLLAVSCKTEKPDNNSSAEQVLDSANTETTVVTSRQQTNFDSLQNADFDQIGFADYVARVPQIDLPFIFSCDSGLVWAKIDYDNNAIKKYKPEGAGILGKLFEKDDAVGFIYTFPADIVFPQIYIYGPDGNEISRMDLFELGDCVSDIGYYGWTRGQITKDLELLASIVRIECDESEANCDTTRTSIKERIY